MKAVVLSYNHPELTHRTVASVCECVAPENVILVHNGSELQHQTRLEKSFPGIAHMVLEKNRGFPGGANAGLRAAFSAGAQWVLFLTNDCQLKAWQRPDGAPALIAPLIWGRKEGRVDSLGASFNPDRAHLSHCKSIEDFNQAPLKYIPGTAFWIHREVFEHLGGFDESLEMFWEDVDFSVRAQRAGFSLLTDSNTRVLHAIGKTTHKHMHYTTYLFQRNRKRISLKYSARPARVYSALWQSWLSTIWFHVRRGNWDRLQLLWQAIRD